MNAPARQKCERAPVSIDEQATIFAEEMPHQVKRLKWLAEHEKMHWGTVAIRKRALDAALETLQRLQRQQAGLARIRAVVACDASAISHQTIGQYRTTLLREIDAELLGAASQAGEGDDHAR